MLNHNNHATMYAYENKTLEWHSSIGYKRGNQVFSRYGRRPNHQLLLHYGFALRENATEHRAVLSKTHRMPFKTNFRLTHDTSKDLTDRVVTGLTRGHKRRRATTEEPDEPPRRCLRSHGPASE
ncbi:hypothetical protein SDRG_08792 [Saprolegnia diclina VS20]|uniref:SET domain-containing protein n=1 Tax=Saprolegnia diclina (strain VS20) TaxID=1156394 RepID=T0RMW5_SAPDV|nr:hypothetical protein SDRG_08792 [Saprolegnia diclina VS20]EQC33688.1 hypothetical protein SDRG_08792 [Saprolegnia diclina VS20]|eukprot:XP_008612911.1 hypothetical protein SDRG_08792 [Saprolegnia diclina VS20]